MIETIILNYLLEHVDVDVFMEVPEDPPEKFIIVEKVNGGKSNMLKSATFAIRSYSGTLLNAAEMNEAVKTVMEDITELDSISSCRFDRDYNFTDTSAKRHRYQSLFVLAYY